MIADIPLQQETPQHIAAEMRFIKDKQLNDVKRGIFIDRLAIGGKQPNAVNNMLEMYDNTDNDTEKAQLIQGLMIYYQQHLNLEQKTQEQFLLKDFFAKLINQKFGMVQIN